jgi:hypothetical protein
MTRAQKRRRDVLIILGCVAIATLLVGLVLGNPLFWVVHGVIDLMLVAYLLLLIRLTRRGALTAFQKGIDTWPTPRRSTPPVSLAHPRVPPRPELAPLSPADSSLPRAAAR